MLYGNESHDTGTGGDTIQFTQPRQAGNDHIFALIRPFTDTEGGGEVLDIDTPRYVEITQPLAPDIGVLSGPAQEDATVTDVLPRRACRRRAAAIAPCIPSWTVPAACCSAGRNAG